MTFNEIVTTFLRETLNAKVFARVDCLTVIANKRHVSYIPRKTAHYLARHYHAHVALVDNDTSLVIRGADADDLTENMDFLARDFRDNFHVHSPKILDNRASMGWRDEKYGVYEINESPTNGRPVFELERSFCSYLGIKTFGVHVNCFYRQNGQIYLWVGRRSPTKQTYPNLLDNCFAGGFTAGMTPLEILVKEANEEASIPADMCDGAKFVGTLECTHHTKDTIAPECEYIFDIELPADFVPEPRDGEMSGFKAVCLSPNVVIATFSEVAEWKPNCYAISLDFAIRHGVFGVDQINDVGLWRRLMNNDEQFVT